MESQSSAVALAVVGQRMDALEKQCSSCAERVLAAVERTEDRESNLQQRLSVLEEWRKAVNGSIRDLEDQYRSIGYWLRGVFGAVVAVLLTLLANLFLKRV
jgi:phage shock protein A